MKTKDIRDLVWFADDEARTETLFETDEPVVAGRSACRTPRASDR